MNVSGIGIDAVELERFAKIVSQREGSFLNKIFTAAEIEYACSGKNKHVHLAGKFAAKEAVKKAIPDGAEIGLAWKEIEVLNGTDGKPYVVLHGKAEELRKRHGLSGIFVSISHSERVAVANAITVKNGT